MNTDFYNIQDILSEMRRKSRELFEENFNSPVNDVGNSYTLAHSMNGPGNGPSNAGETDPANNDTLTRFPEKKVLTVSEKRELLLKFLKDEIDEEEKVDGDDDWDEDVKEAFKLLYGRLLEDVPSQETE